MTPHDKAVAWITVYRECIQGAALAFARKEDIRESSLHAYGCYFADQAVQELERKYKRWAELEAIKAETPDEEEEEEDE